LTDFLDGFLARRWGIVTRLGKLLDPAADKILTSAAFISLVELGVAPAWMVVVIVARGGGHGPSRGHNCAAPPGAGVDRCALHAPESRL
jgi:hypothetical protein